MLVPAICGLIIDASSAAAKPSAGESRPACRRHASVAALWRQTPLRHRLTPESIFGHK